jgi:hypothetical protein
MRTCKWSVLTNCIEYFVNKLKGLYTVREREQFSKSWNLELQTYVYISRSVWFASEWRPNVNCSRAILARTSIWLSLWTKNKEKERNKKRNSVSFKSSELSDEVSALFWKEIVLLVLRSLAMLISMLATEVRRRLVSSKEMRCVVSTLDISETISGSCSERSW